MFTATPTFHYILFIEMVIYWESTITAIYRNWRICYLGDHCSCAWP